MSRKTRRQSRRDAKPTVITQVPEATTAARSSGLNTDYTYILKDLRRIGLLAGSFLVVLIALSFFLR